MNPYRILGLKRGADRDAIRRAYRKLALKHHPDRGGDPVRFKAIQDAYAILNDPAKRAEYDATGKVANNSGFDIQVADALARMFGAAFVQMSQMGATPSHYNLAEKMRSLVQNDIRVIKENIATAKKRRPIVEDAAKRFSDELVAGIVANQVRAIDQEIATQETLLKVAEEMANVLDKCQYRLDAMGGFMRNDASTTTVQWIRADFTSS